jgi:hypothetical protein
MHVLTPARYDASYLLPECCGMGAGWAWKCDGFVHVIWTGDWRPRQELAGAIDTLLYCLMLETAWCVQASYLLPRLNVRQRIRDPATRLRV